MKDINAEPILLKAEGQAPLQKTMLIVCEGKNTEVDYFDKTHKNHKRCYTRCKLKRREGKCICIYSKNSMWPIRCNFTILYYRIKKRRKKTASTRYGRICFVYDSTHSR